MTKKKFKFNFVFDAPVTIVFCLISVILFAFDTFVFKGTLNERILSSPTTISGTLPFMISKPASYFRLILYAFSASNFILLLSNLLFLLMLGPAMEERYGSVVIGIMTGVSVLFSGVLNACFCETSLRGCMPVIFMMIFLNSFMSFSKKKIPVSFILIFILYTAKETAGKKLSETVGLIICISGGLCGSLFAFLTSPKTRAEKKSAKTEKTMTREEKITFLEELDSKSPRNKKNNRYSDDDTTVVGTLKF